MGICVQQWRASIGNFSLRARKKRDTNGERLKFSTQSFITNLRLLSFLFSLLVLVGNVESNPGPRIQVKKSNLRLKRRRPTKARRIFFTNTTTFRIVNTRKRIVNTRKRILNIRGRRIFYKYYPSRIVNIRGRRTIFTITNRESDKRHIFADSIRPC